MALTDQLTQLPNRHFLSTQIPSLIGAARKEGGSLSLIILDIDHFKNINDTHGHDCGDRVLEAIGNLLRAYAEENVISARYGGEELVLLVSGNDLEGALNLAEALRTELAALRPAKLDVTGSFGRRPKLTETMILAHCFDVPMRPFMQQRRVEGAGWNT